MFPDHSGIRSKILMTIKYIFVIQISEINFIFWMILYKFKLKYKKIT